MHNKNKTVQSTVIFIIIIFLFSLSSFLLLLCLFSKQSTMSDALKSNTNVAGAQPSLRQFFKAAGESGHDTESETSDMDTLNETIRPRDVSTPLSAVASRSDLVNTPTSTVAVQQSKRVFSQVDLSPQDVSLHSILSELRNGFAKYSEDQQRFNDRLLTLDQQCSIAQNTALQAGAVATEAAGKIDELQNQIQAVRDISEKAASATEHNRQSNLDMMEKLNRRSEIVIRGLHIDNSMEQKLLHDLVYRIATVVGQPINERDIHFIRVRQQHNSRASIIIVRFSTVTIRDLIFDAYLKRGTLTTSQLGMSTDSRIFLADNLTVVASRINYQARQLKVAGKLAKVTIRKGSIRVTLPNNPSKWISVDTIEQLEKL